MRARSVAVVLGLAVAFLLGREVTRLAEPALVPQARAQVAAYEDPVRWEYTCFHAMSRVDSRANDLGAEGWELVAAAGAGGGGGPMLNQEYFFCFKRPLA